MKTFTDAAGRTWTLSLTLGSAMHVKDRLSVDLLAPEAPPQGDPDGPPLLTRLGTDELLLGQVLCALLEGQFETHKVTDADVRAAFDGATLLAAQKAFYEEMVDFFQARGRTDRARAVAKQMALIDAAIAAVTTRIDAFDPRTLIDHAMDDAMAIPGGHGAMSGASPEASASVPATSGG